MHVGMEASTDSSRVDHSFVVLPKQKYQGHGVPACPQSTTSQPDSSHSAKALMESYVVLPPAAASMYKNESAREGGGAQERIQGESPSSGLQVNDSIILKRVFNIATSQTQVLAVEQPLCLECIRLLSDKLLEEVEDVNQDIKAYESCLQRFEMESYDVLSVADFIQEKAKVMLEYLHFGLVLMHIYIVTEACG
ncbi:hypothetical protein B296_00030229 [Ensete ventricosum]|uniref:Atg6 BARA domain-containing protein n=1 Tax=Ensete ventricosum TaxID=4639 RepID=A0A427AJ90_ENSVE|nr:hypothetical protein B296_00030229 [Ensete ventricosum]